MVLETVLYVLAVISLLCVVTILVQVLYTKETEVVHTDDKKETKPHDQFKKAA